MPSSDARLQHRRVIRSLELDQVAAIFPKGSRVLELGAGAGWQAKMLSERGFDVVAIDIPESNYTRVREWPVIDYDGVVIPLPDESVDVVFSSNVLEHIPHIREFQSEIKRVLKKDGISVHVMPSSTWRLWTSVSFYVDRVKKLALRLLSLGQGSTKHEQDLLTRTESASKQKTTLASKLRKLLVPSCHGERGNVFTELYYFNRLAWLGLFRATGWSVQAVKPNGLFYTGQRVMGSLLSVPARKALSGILGSSCIIYVLKKRPGDSV